MLKKFLAMTMAGQAMSLLAFGAEAPAGGEVAPIASAFAASVLRIDVAVGQQSVAAEWKYTNRWDFPLIVDRVDISCGCLVNGQSADKAVAPGGTGSIRANFLPGNHRGTIRKSLLVRFVGHEKAVELTVEASIPSPVTLSVNHVAWNPGQKAETRQIDVTSGNGAKFNITGLEGVAEKQYAIRRETVKEGTHYRLHITPVWEPVSEMQILQIRTDSPDPRDQVMAVFLQVKP